MSKAYFLRIHRNRSLVNKRLGTHPPVHYNHPAVEPSEPLAYILGVLKGDAFTYSRLTKRGRDASARLSVRSAQFAESFAMALRAIGLHPYQHVLFQQTGFSSGNVYSVQANSVKFVDWYRPLTLSDIGNLLGNRELQLAFVRGFYESEGSFFWAKGCPTASMSNTNAELSYFVWDLLRTLGYTFHLHNYRRQIGKRQLVEFTIRKAGREVKCFLETIQPAIKYWVGEKEWLHMKKSYTLTKLNS